MVIGCNHAIYITCLSSKLVLWEQAVIIMDFFRNFEIVSPPCLDYGTLKPTVLTIGVILITLNKFVPVNFSYYPFIWPKLGARCYIIIIGGINTNDIVFTRCDIILRTE